MIQESEQTAADHTVSVEDVRQRAASMGLNIPEERLEAFAESAGAFRRILATIREQQARRPRHSVFGGQDGL